MILIYCLSEYDVDECCHVGDIRCSVAVHVGSLVVVSIRLYVVLTQYDVDKSARLIDLITNGERYFLSRPRRFGKSLMISTLDAMFSGRVELFRGLSAEDWMRKQAGNPAVVLRFDMSSMDSNSNEGLMQSLRENLIMKAAGYDIGLSSTRLGMMFTELLVNYPRL